MVLPHRYGFESELTRKRMAVIAQNLRDLSSRDPIVVSAAGERLNELAPGMGELLRLLDDRDQYIRAGAAQRLRHASGDEVPIVVESLRAAVHVSNDRVAEAALGSLGYLRATNAVNDIREFLEEPNSRVVHAAIYALGRLGLPDEGQHLVRFLASPEYHLVLTSLNALVHLRYAAAVPAIMDRLSKCLGVARRTRQHFELPKKLISALVTLRALEAVPMLVKIAEEEIGVRGLAVQALIDLKAIEAAPPLVPLLARLVDSPHEERLCTGLISLMQAVDYRFALPEIRRFLGHRLPSVRSIALKVISLWNDLSSVEWVRTLCHNDPSAFVRPAAVAALGRLVGVDALVDFKILANDGNALVREMVARAVGRLRPLPPEGRILLEQLLLDPAAGKVAGMALAFHNGLGSEEAICAILPVTPPVGLLPVELLGQAPSVRAFIQHWQKHLSMLANRAYPGASALLDATRTLLAELPRPEHSENRAHAA